MFLLASSWSFTVVVSAGLIPTVQCVFCAAIWCSFPVMIWILGYVRQCSCHSSSALNTLPRKQYCGSRIPFSANKILTLFSVMYFKWFRNRLRSSNHNTREQWTSHITAVQGNLLLILSVAWGTLDTHEVSRVNQTCLHAAGYRYREMTSWRCNCEGVTLLVEGFWACFRTLSNSIK